MTLPDPSTGAGTAIGAAQRQPRPRYRPLPRSWWQRIPYAVKFGAPLLVAVAAWFGVQQWRRSHLVLEFRSLAGTPPALELTFFPDQLAYATPSPPPPLGRIDLAAGEAATIGTDLVPDRALVRYAGAGVGAGYAALTMGQPPPPLVLGPPGTLSGRIGVADGLLCLGLRSLGLRPVRGARVIGLGGGEHGVVLCETATDAEGRFALTGFDRALGSLGIRVLAPGHAIAHVDWFLGDSRDGPVIALQPTEPIAGRVELPDGVRPEPLRVLARGLPGVEATVGADGSFVLDHVPPQIGPRLLVFGLPADLTHRAAQVAAGQRGVRLQVVKGATVRGFVLDRTTQQPLAGATVWHAYGPTGRAAVVTGIDGSFALDRLPPGEIVIGAQFRIRDPLGQDEMLAIERRLVVEPGVDLQNVILRVE